jgi:actin-related protein 8
MKKLVVTSDTNLIVYFTRFHDYEDMLEDTWHMEFPRRSDISDGLYPSMNVGLPMWDSYPVFSARPKKEEKVGLAEAITSSILSTGRFAYISPTV